MALLSHHTPESRTTHIVRHSTCTHYTIFYQCLYRYGGSTSPLTRPPDHEEIDRWVLSHDSTHFSLSGPHQGGVPYPSFVKVCKPENPIFIFLNFWLSLSTSLNFSHTTFCCIIFLCRKLNWHQLKMKLK